LHRQFVTVPAVSLRELSNLSYSRALDKQDDLKETPLANGQETFKKLPFISKLASSCEAWFL
jgi:hypothetical protein